jgi:hypothetical protein
MADLDVLALDHAGAAVNLNVQDLYTDMSYFSVSRR